MKETTTETITPTERDHLNSATAEQQLCQAKVDAVMAVLIHRYQLHDGDKIMPDGTIVRVVS